MVKNGNRVVFDQDAAGADVSYIENKRSKDKIQVTSSRPESEQLSRQTRKSKNRLMAALEEQDAN